MNLRLYTELRQRTALECPVCKMYIDQSNGNLKSYMPVGDVTDGVGQFLALVKANCCPLCGTGLPGYGQTDDEIIERYCEHLKAQEKPCP